MAGANVKKKNALQFVSIPIIGGLGMLSGGIVGFYFLCFIYHVPFSLSEPMNKLGIPSISFFLLLPFAILGIPCVGIPVFLLFLRPFYSKENINRLILSGQEDVIDPGTIAFKNLMNKIAFFWVDLLFRDVKRKN